MHEIIHLQFGPRSNHVGTHAWNLAESQFAYDDEDVDYGIDLNVDWRQGLDKEGEETFMPRLILSDLKENFGALPNINALYGADPEEDEDAEYPHQILQTSPAVAPSAYQTFLASEAEADPVSEEPILEPRLLEKTRYWSDYNRVWYHPRTMNPLPAIFRREKDEAGLGQGVTYWGEGLEAWKAASQLDPSISDQFRLFAEESDLLQGIQLSLDISTGFAAMGCELVAEFKDENPKGDGLAVGLMGSLLPGQPEKNEIARCFTEAQGIRSLLEHGISVLPIQEPETSWSSESFSSANPLVKLSPSNSLQSSALIATHLASAFLPLRLNMNRTSLPTLLQKLNWRGDTRLIGLVGRAPVWDARASLKADQGWDFSSTLSAREQPVTPFYAHTVTRGLPSSSLEGVRSSLEAISGGLKGHLLTFLDLPQPLPLSHPFPEIFLPAPAAPSPPKSLPLISTLTTSTISRHVLASRADTIAHFLSRHGDMRASGMGDAWGRDEGRELVEALIGFKEGFAEAGEDDEADEVDPEERDY